MAVRSDPDPIDLEVDRVLADDPALVDELGVWDRRFREGEVSDDEFVSAEEVRRRLGLQAPLAERDEGSEPHETGSHG